MRQIISYIPLNSKFEDLGNTIQKHAVLGNIFTSKPEKLFGSPPNERRLNKHEYVDDDTTFKLFNN